MARERLSCQIAVIGSGPGGAVTACTLAEAGRDVLLLEEGPSSDLVTSPFSLDEMRLKYRNGGVNSTMGGRKIAWVEGRCTGGGSEINSGLYHRTPAGVLERWQTEFGIEALKCADLERHFQACEQAVSVSYLPGEAPAASLRLAEGAQALGWKFMEVPRWFRYEGARDSGGAAGGTPQTMSRTFLPRAVQAGCRIRANSRVVGIRSKNGGVQLDVRSPGGPAVVECDDVFVCAGAVQSPALLRRSGYKHRIGNTLAMHPTVKVVAQFDDIVNREDMGVPVHQVKEFAPRFSFGCSISSRPYLALAMSPHAELRRRVLEDWQYAAIYYVMTNGGPNGRVRTLPWASDPLVSYGPSQRNLQDLGLGLRRLCELLFAAGARKLHPVVGGIEPLRSPRDLSRIPAELPAEESSLMTIHLFSSCPMGERGQCATNSFGQLRGVKHVYVNDASLLPTAPGVNPQGSIMAIARRNALHYLGQL
jgi:choline dehydrogenase-like flavoprotein